MRVNLLKETIEVLNENNKQESDVLWVGRNYYNWEKDEQVTYKSTWDDFCNRSDFYYDNGYGCEEIPIDLIVVGNDFWLERHNYDGAEWWEFKSMPIVPNETRELEFLGC